VRSQALVAVTLSLACLTSPLRSQVVDAAGPPGSELTVYLMTMGQGDLVWERYGHNAIVITDRRARTEVVYNWGLFSFDEPGFIGNFLRGENMYWMGGQDFAATVAEYRMRNRTVELQELNLSPPQRQALYDFIRFNAREENKYYRYDYFRENCSTRVRDALDSVLGGAIRQRTDTLQTGFTLRFHALRLMAGLPFTTTGVNIALARPTDRPITAWEEMFIPMKVRDWVREIRVPDDSGRMVPLVLSERVLFEAQREPERTAPPMSVVPLGIIGLLLASGLAWLGKGRTGAVGVSVGVGVLIGTLGLVLAFLWFLTEHVAAYGNTNMFVYNPLWWVLVFALPFARRSPRAATAVHYLATGLALLASFGVIAPFLPGLRQGSFAVIALAAPLAITAAWIIRERYRPAIAAQPA
jgi:hypothetical protein